MRLFVFVFCVLTIGSGCQSVQFRNPIVMENAPQPESPYQQVMQNFATFAVAPDAVPGPALPNNGTNAVQQPPTPAGGVSQDTSFLGLGEMFLNPSDVKSPGPKVPQPIVQTSMSTGTLDPDRIQLMRCAYQKVLGYQFADQPGNSAFVEMFKPEPQLLTPIMTPGWVHIGTPYDLPARAAHVAYYGKVCVWVMPEDVHNLSQFARAMSDISTASPHPRAPTPAAAKTAHAKAAPADQIRGAADDKTVNAKASADQIRVIADVYASLPEPVDAQQKAEHLLLQMRMYGELERLACLYSNQPDKRDRFVGNVQQFVDRAAKTFDVTNTPKAEKDRFKERANKLQKELLEHFDSAISPPATAQLSHPKFESNAVPASQKTVPQP